VAARAEVGGCLVLAGLSRGDEAMNEVDAVLPFKKTTGFDSRNCDNSAIVVYWTETAALDLKGFKGLSRSVGLSSSNKGRYSPKFLPGSSALEYSFSPG
jgi:hypothetical protein